MAWNSPPQPHENEMPGDPPDTTILEAKAILRDYEYASLNWETPLPEAWKPLVERMAKAIKDVYDSV